jgi:hypothetical protein
VIDAARRKGKTSADLRRLARDRIAFRQWTEDPTLQGSRDRYRRRRIPYRNLSYKSYVKSGSVTDAMYLGREYI